MPGQDVHQCQCPICSQRENHADRELHHQFNLLLSRLDEQQRRWMVALESAKSEATIDVLIDGLSLKTTVAGKTALTPMRCGVFRNWRRSMSCSPI